MVVVGVADLPSQPSAPTRSTGTSKSSITVLWSSVSDTQSTAGTITGYYLYMDDGNNGDFSVVYNGAGLPSTLTSTITGLTTGLPYRFYVTAVNYIGESVASSYSTFYSCIAPSGFTAPYKGTVTSSSVLIVWSEPTDDGGCSISSYSIYRDDGNGGSFVEVHASSVNNNPSLTQFTVTDLPTNPTGLTVKFKMSVTNVGGFTVTSPSISVVIASTPTTPTSAPYSDSSVTTSNIIKIIYAEPYDGGSEITNYEI